MWGGICLWQLGRGSETPCSKVLPGPEAAPQGLGGFPRWTAPLGPSPGSCSTSGLAFPRLGDTLGDLSLSPLIACLSVAKQLGWEVQSVLGVGLSSASPSPQERPRAALRRVSFHVCKMA